ncbi:hypothetical protein TELCIR_14889 [Teladorsagia circumcincta]|uniref:DUF7930 domain-containing protein n=1 Tax=Teladorsagia circumcincta TaxID=45464 RepID=A0A2G9TZQ8_TELCI|nr:hypothetical protein TELCIR_14889 [Teladorsagia circumcincta]
MVEKITVNGRLTRVETKFAFIETSHGSVFCPLAAAIPSSEHVPNFSMRYNVGDIVRVIMVRQLNNVLETDNNFLRASYTTAGPSGSNVALITDKCVVVTNVSETLAFGISDEFGSVFIPGAAFSAEEVTRLNSYLNIGDELLVSIRPQGDVNGCRWIATSATKLKRSQEPVITGCGKIMSLSKTHAVVWCPVYGEIKCSILSWIGGDGGTNAEWLDDLLNIVLLPIRLFLSLPHYMGLARDDCSTLAKRASGQTVVCAVLSSTAPPTIKDDTGTTRLSSLPDEMIAEEGDPCLFLFECSVQPPRCLRATPIPPELVPVMKFLLMKFREYEEKAS